MLMPTYTKNILTALFNQTKSNTTPTVSFLQTPYLALFTSINYDATNGAYIVQEVPFTANSKSTGYARKLMCGDGIYGDDPLMGASAQILATNTSSEITISTTVAIPRGNQTFKVYYKISGSSTIYDVDIIIPAGSQSGNSTSNLADGSTLQSGTIESVSFTDGLEYGKQSMTYITNRDVIAIGECINTAWASSADSKSIVGFGIYNTQTAGTLAFIGELTTPIHVEIGQIPIFRVADFRIVIG